MSNQQEHQGLAAPEVRHKSTQPAEKKQGIIKVIAASSAGTLIEWYDFYIFGSLATIIATSFFPKGNETVQLT